MALQVTSSGPDQETVLAGTVLSGDHFVNSEEERQALWGQYRGQCVEQEGAGVARTCHESDVPWMVIRGISDLADGHVMRDFQENSRYAAANAAEVAFRLVSLLVTVSDLGHLEMIQTQMS
jgi:adenosylhomocysteine nucleosidase